MTIYMTNRTDQIKALSSESRIEILRLLDDAAAHFGHQESADPAEFGVCVNLIAEKLGVSQPTASRHIDLLKRAGFLKVRRWRQWSYCSRDEAAIGEYHRWLRETLNVRAS